LIPKRDFYEVQTKPKALESHQGISMRAVLILSLVGCVALASGCGEKSPGTSGQSGIGSAPSGGSATGGSATGGSATGGSATGGSGGTTGGVSGVGGVPEGTGGFPDPYEGYPDWVRGCAASRNLAQCPSCLTPECIVCTYGTDEEIEDTESRCTESAQAYADYCDCAACANSVGGACRFP
jgi:hypothetical protein